MNILEEGMWLTFPVPNEYRLTPPFRVPNAMYSVWADAFDFLSGVYKQKHKIFKIFIEICE